MARQARCGSTAEHGAHVTRRLATLPGRSAQTWCAGNRGPVISERLAAFSAGDRVQTHPASDTWMSGDRYGTVQTVGRKYVTVRLDRSGRAIRFHPTNVLLVD